MKSSAKALHTALGKKQKGVAEADALLKGSADTFDATLQLPPDSSAAAAWTPVRQELTKVVLAYEVRVAGPETAATGTTGSTAPLVFAAAGRLTDPEVKALLESIERKRSAFEAALDDKLKNSNIKGERGQVKANEFFDDLQDQVQRARERFASNYSASSEVLSLLQFAARLDAWASMQPAGFRGSKEWGALATDFQRLSAAYNSGLLRPAQQARGAQARRLNDAELVTAAATIDKNMDAFEPPTTARWLEYDPHACEPSDGDSERRRHEDQREGAPHRAGEKAEGRRGGRGAVEGEPGHDGGDVAAPTELLGGGGVGAGSRGAGKSRVGL